MNDALRRFLRTLLQLVAGGGLTALVAVIAGGLSPYAAAILTAASTLAVNLAQNLLEQSGKVPTLLPSPPAGTTDAPLVQPR